MPKSQFLDPETALAPGEITFQSIPVNRYSPTAGEELEKGRFTKDELLQIYRDMVLIRSFENMLHSIKTLGAYRKHAFMYTGPAHLAIGEEAYAVAQAWVLEKEDFIFGGHRGHHEIIAKALSAIRKLPENELMEIMENYHGGRQLAVLREHGNYSGTQELARLYFLYGLAAEIFARETGFSKGLGGSMHAFFMPFGIYPNNAIVGASACTAVGAALFKKCNRRKGIVVANLGDGSLGCGPVWESVNFAAMDQFRELWEEDYKGGLPVLFHIANNGYGMGGQTCGETMAYGTPARLGAAAAANQLHAEKVNGLNPLAAIDACRRKKELLLRGEGPALLDVVTYRLTGHSASDATPSYRTREELQAWQEYDSIRCFGRELEQAGVCGGNVLSRIAEEADEMTERVFLLASDPKTAPPADFSASPGYVGDILFSNGRAEKLREGEPEVLLPLRENPRVIQLQKRSRSGFGDDGALLPPPHAPSSFGTLCLRRFSTAITRIPP